MFPMVDVLYFIEKEYGSTIIQLVMGLQYQIQIFYSQRSSSKLR